MTAKLDLEKQIAVGLAELINSRSCRPSLEELRTFVREAYLRAMLSIKAPITPPEICHNLAETIAEVRAEQILTLINAKSNSPTVQDIMNVLCPPQRGARRVVKIVPRRATSRK